MKNNPSKAQARCLACLFADNSGVHVSENYVDATVRVLVKRAWVSETSDGGAYPNGSTYKIWKINASGLAALESFLREHRIRQTGAGLVS